MSQFNNTTLMDSLKEAISAQHARMEALPFIVALSNVQLPLESYIGQLRAMAVIHGTLEHEASLLPSGDIRTLMLGRPSRLVHIRKDLSIFDQQYIPDIEAALEQTARLLSGSSLPGGAAGRSPRHYVRAAREYTRQRHASS